VLLDLLAQPLHLALLTHHVHLAAHLRRDNVQRLCRLLGKECRLLLRLMGLRW
jgi:hypothetical protein